MSAQSSTSPSPASRDPDDPPVLQTAENVQAGETSQTPGATQASESTQSPPPADQRGRWRWWRRGAPGGEGPPPDGAQGPPPLPGELPAGGWLGDGRMLSSVPSWLTSLIVHMIVLVLMAMMTIHVQQASFLEALTFGTSEIEGNEPDFAADRAAIDIPAPTMDAAVSAPIEPATELPNLSETPILQRLENMASLAPLEAGPLASADLLGGSFSGPQMESALRGRSGADKLRLLREGGGTLGSEEAVKLALVWLKNHQNRDGSWSFDLPVAGCTCPDRGELRNAFIGGTAMALLPFLGAGYTHDRGVYREEVRAGLYYLIARQQRNGSLWEPGGQMYSHGLASIVLCEAYAMTGDKSLAEPAQAALNFISYAQDPVGGGWRYVPREPGDTSVVGWQLMALKSGHMAYLTIHPATLEGARHFLDSVQTEDGSGYGYQAPGEKPSTTAIGLLCRMYMGWGHDEPALVTGVERLSKSGRSDVDMYYNYYATQVMRHFGGKPWEKWNAGMRDWLVKTQARQGHQTGSWHMGENDSAALGGRLYNTSMAAMILEVYYRHMPLYQSQAAEEAFEF